MADDKSISLANLLDEMLDLVALTRDSHPKYRIVHFSSYDRASVSPGEPEGWFANKDYGPFIRKEVNQGREEHVIAEFDGPGCLNRLWAPDNRLIHIGSRVEEGPSWEAYSRSLLISRKTGHLISPR